MSSSVKARPRHPAPIAAPKRPLAIWLVIVGALVVALVVALLVAGRGSTKDPSNLAQVQAVNVTGTPLATFSDRDTAVGQPIPTVTGATFDASPVTIKNDGRAKVIFFVAHWCPHCQAEVPVITRWLASTNPPATVDLYAVSTAVSANQPNYPPSAWLARENWPIVTMADDNASSAARAFGLSGYPFFVVVKADGTVAVRASGELSVSQLDALVRAATSK